MASRLGQVLIERDVLSSEQVEAILLTQAKTHRPFGALAEEMFDIPPEAVEEAWSLQYEEIAERIDPTNESIDHKTLGLIDRRQAWQFRMVPLRREGGELRVATTRPHLARAMRFALRHFGQACYFVLSGPDELAAALTTHYPMAGMSAEAVRSTEPIYHAKNG